MTDGRTRALQRRYRETGDVQDGVAWIRSWQREGTLELKRLELAALVGDPLARAAIERPDDMGQVLSWSQSDDYWEGFVLDLSYSHHYWDVEQTTVHRECQNCVGDGYYEEHTISDSNISRCPECKGEGTVEELTEPKSAARDELLFRAALACARQCQKDRMQEWHGQGRAIDAILYASEAWLEDPCKSKADVIQLVTREATDRYLERYLERNVHLSTGTYALPRWARFDRFFSPAPEFVSGVQSGHLAFNAATTSTPVSMVHDEIIYETSVFIPSSDPEPSEVPAEVPTLLVGGMTTSYVVEPEPAFAAFTLFNALSVIRSGWIDVALSLLRAANHARSDSHAPFYSETDPWETRLRDCVRSTFIPFLLA